MRWPPQKAGFLARLSYWGREVAHQGGNGACDRLLLCALPRWLCSSEGRGLRVFAETLRRLVGRFCGKSRGGVRDFAAKLTGEHRRRPHSGVDDRPGVYCLIFNCVTPTVSHPAWYRRNKLRTPRVSIDAWPDTRMGVTRANPPIARPMKRNYGAKKMTVLNVGRFVRSGVGHCPEIPHIVVRVGAPERHTRSMSVANARPNTPRLAGRSTGVIDLRASSYLLDFSDMCIARTTKRANNTPP
jgi:hypothetical protein